MPVTVARPRVHELDAVRGFALCGILVVNIWQITGMRATDPTGSAMDPLRHVLSVLFEGRFFPIFSFLFGLSFAMFLDGPAQRADRPRLVLVRRLVALGLIGVIHLRFQPGEALLPYAIVGLVVLLPAASLPRWLILVGGLVATVGVALTLGGGFGLVPGLFLLGMAAARYGLVDDLRDRTWQIAAVFALALPAAIVMSVWEWRTPYLELWTSSVAPIAGLLGALTYITGLLLLLRTGFGDLLAEILAPLGRMALTNYVTATALILLADRYLHLEGTTRYPTLLVLAAGIILLQAVLSHLWLTWLRYGPLEWLWRCVTWWHLVPIREPRNQGIASIGLPRH
ncbi:DUF418 domain-containing protein [Nocardia puris]|uniref:Putative membrane protein YeiB n=1 Tax=Nocardia puris TaxID=208602 RepID=A0A366D9B1_9NOCA|nr:DUF418 domain-containing protein [Nocardia puris]RBO86630.1 putative membrane protein YeiB [Nocardia puris]